MLLGPPTVLFATQFFFLTASAGAGTQKFYNDLWRFNISSRSWTWLSGSQSAVEFRDSATLSVRGPQGVEGPNYTPGAVGFGSSWVDAGRGYLWMFGGETDELWRYSLATGLWAFFRGIGAATPAEYNSASLSLRTPGSRLGAAVFYDSPNQKVWLFGGASINSAFS